MSLPAFTVGTLQLMELRRVAAAGCAVAGVWLLAGPGWALIAAAVLLTVTPMRWRIGALRFRVAVRRAWTSTQARLSSPVSVLAGRKVAAVVAVPPALVLTAVGAGVLGGPGAGLVVGGVALGGLSLMSGWNTG